MVRVPVVALSVTCASAFRTAQEAGVLDVEEAQVHSHSHGMASLFRANSAALFKRVTQPDGTSCEFLIQHMIQSSPDICTTLQMMDDESLGNMFQGRPCTRTDVEASCGGGPMTCAEGLEAMVSLMTSHQPTADPAMSRASVCIRPEDEAQAHLPAGCADFAAVETACGGCSMASYMDGACSQPFTDASGSGSTPGEPSGASAPQNCSTYLAGENTCEMAVIVRPPTIRMIGGPECTPAEIQEACGAGPASCGAAMNALLPIQRQMMVGFGQEPPTDAQLRAEMCSTPPENVDDLAPQCEDFAAVQASCGGCTNTTLDACAEAFAEPTTTTATTTTSNAKMSSLGPLVAALFLFRLW